MKLASFYLENPNDPEYGIIEGNDILTPKESFKAKYPTLRDVIEGD